MNELSLTRDQYLELENLHTGVFSPLRGFMNEAEFHSVVERMRLPDGAVFPLPVVLGITAEQQAALQGDQKVELTHAGRSVGILAPEGFYRCDKLSVCARVFGTTDPNHPGVANFLRQGDVLVGGPVILTQRAALDISPWEFTPEQTKAEFARRGWKTVAGFQTRNVPHRAHEYLQRVALELCDGLFIQPLVGWKKASDYTPEAIIKGYQALIGEFFPSERVCFGILSTPMRYAGPREAVFHALIRRNYGCTHFVVGRDHAGVGNYYGKYDAHELTRRFDGELGIEILRLHGPYHCRRCGGIVTEQTCPHLLTHPDATRQINGTDIRATFQQGQPADPEIIRPEVVASLAGIKLFVGSD